MTMAFDDSGKWHVLPLLTMTGLTIEPEKSVRVAEDDGQGSRP